MFVPVLVLALLAAFQAVPLAHGAAVRTGAEASWRLPLSGPSVSGGFSFDRRRPFMAGQRRVVVLRGGPREVVRAPCTGGVTFAGELPSGTGLSLRCGRLSATLTGLGSVSARRGALLAAGQPLGRLGPGGRLLLGARVRSRRHGYIDPLALMAPVSRPAPLAPVLRPGRPLRPGVRRQASPRPGLPVAAVLLAAAWLGLGVAGTAVGVGIALRSTGRAPQPARRARPAGR